MFYTRISEELGIRSNFLIHFIIYIIIVIVVFSKLKYVLLTL